MQSVSASIDAVCRKTLQKVNRDSEPIPRPKNSVKNYMSAKIDDIGADWVWKVCIDSTTMAFMADLVTYLTALGRHWKSGATGGILAVAIMLSSTFYPLPKYVVGTALLGYVLVAGFFLRGANNINMRWSAP